MLFIEDGRYFGEASMSRTLLTRILLIGRRLNLAALALVSLVAVTGMRSAGAVTYTWTQGAGTGNANQVWGTSANWAGSPTLTFNNTTDLVFDNASVVNRANALAIGGNRTIRSISIGANYIGASDLTFDIQTYQTINTTARTLTFQADSGNASVTLAQSTSGAVQVRLGHSNGGNIILTSSLDIAQNNTFLDTSGNGLQIEGKLQGSGNVNKTGAGLLRILRSNTAWTGNMNINEGAVQVGNDPGNAFGQGTWTLGGGANNTSLIIRRFFENGVAANPGGIVVAAGDGTRTIANTAFDSGGLLNLGGNITLDKDAIFNVASGTAYTSGSSMTLSGTVTGAGGIIKTSDGTLILARNNTYTGLTTISGGTLSIGSGGTTGAVAGSILNDAALVFDRSDALTYSGTIGGSGSVTKRGAGQLTFTGSNSYSGVTTISGGTLSIGSGGTAGAVAGSILNNAALVFDRSDSITFSGTIGGSGGLAKQGAGALTLTGSSSYAGATAVNVGGLLVDGTLSGVGLTSVASGAWFGGDGSLAGGLTLLSGAQFMFNSSATLDVTGAVALDNNFSVSSLVAANGGAIDWGSIADGTYTLINTTSTFNNILNFGAANAADIGGGRTAYFQNGSLQLVVVPEPGALALAGLGIAAAAWVFRRRA
jgi:autotransporter-associated beta strand protein